MKAWRKRRLRWPKLGHLPKGSRLVFTIVPTFVLLGLVAWRAMPRQEDPSFPYRFATVSVFYPGADPETVERLIMDPIEEELAQVQEIKHTVGSARSGVASWVVELHETIYDTHFAWDRVRAAIKHAQTSLPSEASEPRLDDRIVDQEAIVLAVTGATDPLALREGARKLRSALLRLEQVSRVNLVADPEEQVTIEFDEAVARRLGVNQRTLAAQLRARNVAIPGGTVRVGTMQAAIRPEADFESVEEIEHMPIVLPSGSSVELGDLAKVRRGPREPARVRMRHNGRPAVGLGVVARKGVHLLDFGTDVRRVVREVQPKLAPLRVEDVSFQPTYVQRRLSGLGWSLLLSIAIVALVLFATMGSRAAWVVGLTVPVVALITLALFWIGGGVLHQMSIAALVIALGMLVDNAIVVVENVQSRIDNQEPPPKAVRDAIRELRFPLFIATATTLAAFLPMAIAQGSAADFMRALPIVIMLALALSLVVALAVTPIACALVLRRHVTPTPANRTHAVAERLSRLGNHHHRAVLMAGGALVALAVASSGLLEQRFFPIADRDQMVVELRQREGTHLSRVDEAAQWLEKFLQDREEVASKTTLVGRPVPRFYYNIGGAGLISNFAQILIATRGTDKSGRLADAIRSHMAHNAPNVHVTVRRLEQGPYVLAPIEERLYGDDLEELQKAADIVRRQLKRIAGTQDVRSELDFGAPTVSVNVVDAAAGRRGVARSDVALALLGQSRGLDVGDYRGGDLSSPIILRSSHGEETHLEDLPGTAVPTPSGGHIALGSVATSTVQWRPAAIQHRDGRRMTRVLAGLDSDTSFGPVLATLDERLASIKLPPGVSVEHGGGAEGAGQANTSLLVMLPIGLVLILVLLLIEFNSFRRVAIILCTVPLCAVGVIPGLLIAGLPFGFMSLLGVMALAGIVVNNAIVLLDFVERARGEGHSVQEALAMSVKMRARPILLTTATTIGGLLPLAFSSSTLWPPLAWAMMSGLLASALLTLFVVPALYRVLIPDQDEQRTAAEEQTHTARVEQQPNGAAPDLVVVDLSQHGTTGAPNDPTRH